jgi:hypothetical protein
VSKHYWEKAAWVFAGAALLAALDAEAALDYLFIRVDADGYCTIENVPLFSCDRLTLELRDVLHVPFEKHIDLSMGEVPTKDVKRRQEILIDMLKRLKAAGYNNAKGAVIEPPQHPH